MKKQHREYAMGLGAVAVTALVYFIGPAGGLGGSKTPSSSSGAPAVPPPSRASLDAEPQPPDESSSAEHAAEHPPDMVAAPEPPIAFESPRVGPAAPRVTIVEAGDFQCAACAGVPALIRRVLETWPDDVAVVFKSNPRPSHERSLPAAMAAAAASRQGKFWEYHDKLLTEQKLGDSDLARYARELALDPTRFEADRGDRRLQARLVAEQKALEALGHEGPLVLLVNGRSIQGALTFDAVQDAVGEQLKAARAALADGGSAEGMHQALARANVGPEFPVYWERLILGRTPQEAPPPVPTTALADLLTGRGRLLPPVDPTVWKAELLGHEPVKGKPDALVTIVEFSDFQCDYCADVLPTLKRITEKYRGDVRLVWKNNPIASHNRGVPAALAAMAAHDQGKFWEMHDRLFASQSALSDADLGRHAAAVGLDLRLFNLAIKQGRHRDHVQKDQEMAEKINARGAPAFFVNGRVLRGARRFEELDALVDEELTRARALGKSAAAGDRYATLMASAKLFEPVDPKVNTFTLTGRPTRGTASGDLTLVAYLDFESLNCADLAAALNELSADEAWKSRLKVIVKQFPHPMRPMARDAAMASLAANEQGKFWEMLAKLFANQRYLMPFQLANYAEEIRLDQAKYKAYMDGAVGKRILEEDAVEARAAGIEGTPTVYANGRLIRPAAGYSSKSLKAILSKYFPRK